MRRDGQVLDVMPRTLSSTHVTMYKECTSAFVDARAQLDVGVVLQWMDIAACLSAERHAQTNAVTLSMDDLHFDVPVQLGSTVRLDAQVNKVFGTSMEVGCAVVTEQRTQSGARDVLVCTACFTFVALGPDGKKVKVDEALATTPEETFRATLAAERKAWRLKRAALEKEYWEALEATTSTTRPVGQLLLDDGAHEYDSIPPASPSWRSCCCSPDPIGTTPHGDLVSFSATQLVLPNMANHHGNTFGGQIMAWMSEAAVVAAKRQALASAVLPPNRRECVVHANVQIIDALQFLAKSSVADRVILRAKVHRVFDTSMEVGVTVQAVDVASIAPRTINQGFVTVGLTLSRGSAASSGKQVPLLLRPSASPEADDPSACSAHTAALLRLRLRMQRRQMFALRADAMIWSYLLKEELCICNLLGRNPSAGSHSPTRTLTPRPCNVLWSGARVVFGGSAARRSGGLDALAHGRPHLSRTRRPLVDGACAFHLHLDDVGALERRHGSITGDG